MSALAQQKPPSQKKKKLKNNLNLKSKKKWMKPFKI